MVSHTLQYRVAVDVQIATTFFWLYMKKAGGKTMLIYLKVYIELHQTFYIVLSVILVVELRAFCGTFMAFLI